MSKTTLSMLAGLAFLAAGLLSLQAVRSPLPAILFSGVATLLLIRAFMLWRKPGA